MSHGDFHDNFLLHIRKYRNPDTSVLTSISFSAVPAFDGGCALLTGKGREYMYLVKFVPFYFQFSIYAQGLESFVDSSAVPEGVEPEDPTAGLSLDLLDVLLRPVQFFKGSSELMSAVWSAPSEPVSALAVSIHSSRH